MADLVKSPASHARRPLQAPLPASCARRGMWKCRPSGQRAQPGDQSGDHCSWLSGRTKSISSSSPALHGDDRRCRADGCPSGDLHPAGVARGARCHAARGVGGRQGSGRLCHHNVVMRGVPAAGGCRRPEPAFSRSAVTYRSSWAGPPAIVSPRPGKPPPRRHPRPGDRADSVICIVDRGSNAVLFHTGSIRARPTAKSPPPAVG